MTGDIGKIYSQALFELTLELGTTEEVYKDLNDCRRIFDDNPDFVKVLSSPSILTEEKETMIDNVFGKEGTVHDFICVVTDHGRLRSFGKMTDEFGLLYDEHNGIADMTVVTSVPLKPQAREKLLKKLEEKSGKKIRLSEEVDASILGGVILKTRDTQIDNSVKGRLNAIANKLKV